MVIKSNYKKVSILEKPNGVFVIFNDFDHHEDFSGFLDFLRQKLGINISEPTQYPYSVASEFLIDGENVIAMFHDDLGCCARVDPGNQQLANHIVRDCYGGQ